jgi:hypothetical protein
MNAKATGTQSAVRLGPEIRSRIGRQLRAMYDDVVSQGVPDRLADLLKNLDAPPGKEDK